tara:strand:+ start:263 stop:388 length:126 start_codon:yes stop_codon:yes gene_type:complete
LDKKKRVSEHHDLLSLLRTGVLVAQHHPDESEGEEEKKKRV